MCDLGALCSSCVEIRRVEKYLGAPFGRSVAAPGVEPAYSNVATAVRPELPLMTDKNNDYDFPPLSATDPVRDWKRWKRDLMAALTEKTDDSGTSAA